ncbi:MAG: hypothetical protein EZS28_040384 [Streblomastix strix]|uniref:Uncharacterized protein n=1 Tax=Streblomastix strix TaxID=222440 RepID=A0A5J4U1D0_9EUKA|nr:MAG: hypothetical protein EZS28_040384 [Streblomastix strix]
MQLEKTVVIELDNYYSKLESQNQQESLTLEQRLSQSSLAVVQPRKKLIVGHITPYRQKLQGGTMIETIISLQEKQQQGLSLKSLSQEEAAPQRGQRIVTPVAMKHTTQGAASRDVPFISIHADYPIAIEQTADLSLRREAAP